MESKHRDSADTARTQLAAGNLKPTSFREVLEGIPPTARDAWLDRVLGIEQVASDGPHLPRGCTPYLPCSVDSVLQVVDLARVQPTDVFVDIGSGVGRTGLLVHFLTGASVTGIEIQPALAAENRAYTRQLNVSRFSIIEGDAAELTRHVVIGSVFFMYCPFGGRRLQQVLDSIAPLAATRPIRVCSVDVTLPARQWLHPRTTTQPMVTVCWSIRPPPGSPHLPIGYQVA